MFQKDSEIEKALEFENYLIEHYDQMEDELHTLWTQLDKIKEKYKIGWNFAEAYLLRYNMTSLKNVREILHEAALQLHYEALIIKGWEAEDPHTCEDDW